MQYSPKLKKAMAEITAVLEKYDIAGFIILTEPGFSEIHTKINPSWSSARVTGQGDNRRIEILGKKSHFKNVQERNKVLSDTCNMVHHMTTLIVSQANGWIGLHDLCVKNYGLKEEGGHGYTGNDVQNT